MFVILMLLCVVADARQQSQQPIVNLIKLAGLSVSEVESIMGKSNYTDKITDEYGFFREYKVNGNKHGLLVRYSHERAVGFVLRLPKAVDSPETALQMAGIDIGRKDSSVREPHRVQWLDISIDGLEFEYVRVSMERYPEKRKYDAVRVQIVPK